MLVKHLIVEPLSGKYFTRMLHEYFQIITTSSLVVMIQRICVTDSSNTLAEIVIFKAGIHSGYREDGPLVIATLVGKLVLKKVTVYRLPDGELSIHLYPNLPQSL